MVDTSHVLGWLVTSSREKVLSVMEPVLSYQPTMLASATLTKVAMEEWHGKEIICCALPYTIFVASTGGPVLPHTLLNPSCGEHK